MPLLQREKLATKVGRLTLSLAKTSKWLQWGVDEQEAADVNAGYGELAGGFVGNDTTKGPA